MTATASDRRRIMAWTLSMAGHVATTIITDHATDSRNGRNIQNTALISKSISSTDSTVSVRSRRKTGAWGGSVITLAAIPAS